MNRGNGLPDRVIEQDRRTVRREAAERHVWLICKNPVTDGQLLPVKADSAVPSANAQQPVGMLLPGKDNLLWGKSDSAAQNMIIFAHPLRLIAAVRAKIH